MTSCDHPGLPSCRELVEQVSAYLDGELDRDQAVRIDAHLALCGECGTYVEQMRLTLRLLGEAPPEPVSPELERRVLEAFRAFQREQEE